ncbi:MAG: FprA family A-type flavoprotein [Candidatus Zipacnadales bacterium]
MELRKIAEGIYWAGVVDWDRRLFDSLIPLPDGTSYNAYLVEGNSKQALIDTVDQSVPDALLEQLRDVPRLDYIISHHAEQDHSGAIPQVLERYPEAQVVCTEKAQPLLGDLLGVPRERCMAVGDGDTIDLGGKTLHFLHTPWVHWPETMVTWLAEERILFSCDFFGSHLASSELYASWEEVERAAKRYYGEIMMPFAGMVARNIAKVRELRPHLIAPSHGPLLRDAEAALNAWEDWASGPPKNLAVVPYVSMHGSTRRMVEHLTSALAREGVRVRQFDLVSVDLGELAIALVEAGTIVLGTPTVLTRPHPLAASAAMLTNALKPKAKYATVIGSYGWGGRVVETVTSLLSDLKLEILEPVLCKGVPRASDLDRIASLAKTIAQKHAEEGFPPLGS